MNTINIQQKLDELARGYLGVLSVHPSEQHVVTTSQIKKVLMESYLMGEKSGYQTGFESAKMACDCTEETCKLSEKSY